MKHDPVMREWWLHPMHCGCSLCAPAAASRGLTRLDRISLQIVAGLAFGWLLTFLLDWLLGGPVFGL